MANEVVLVRHGETEWSRDQRHTGLTDVDLTERGREEARLAGLALRRRRFAAVLVSPLRRARDTCALAGLAADAQVRDDLVEWDYGAYEGRTTEDIRGERPDWSLWRDGCPDGESPEQVGHRADAVLAVLADLDGDVAVVSHGHLLRVLAARWIALPPSGGARLALATAALCTLGHERETPVLQRWNEVSHLEGRLPG